MHAHEFVFHFPALMRFCSSFSRPCIVVVVVVVLFYTKGQPINKRSKQTAGSQGKVITCSKGGKESAKSSVSTRHRVSCGLTERCV